MKKGLQHFIGSKDFYNIGGRIKSYLSNPNIGYLLGIKGVVSKYNYKEETQLSGKFSHFVRIGSITGVMKCVKLMDEKELLFFIDQIPLLAMMKFPGKNLRNFVLVILDNMDKSLKSYNRNYSSVMKSLNNLENSLRSAVSQAKKQLKQTT